MSQLSQTITHHKRSLDSFIQDIKSDIHTHAMDTVTQLEVELHNSTKAVYAGFEMKITDVFNDSLTVKLQTFKSSVQEHIDTVTSDVLNQFQNFTKNFKDQATLIISDALHTVENHNNKNNKNKNNTILI